MMGGYVARVPERDVTRSADLPFVDAHSRLVDATPEVCWDAMVAVLPATGPLPQALALVLGCRETERQGGADAVGSTMPAFRVAASERPRLWELEGAHRFSSYRLRFDVQDLGGGQSKLRASTYAAFPGLLGTGYRLMVIGSRGHRVAVRRMLGLVAQRAERPRPAVVSPGSSRS